MTRAQEIAALLEPVERAIESELAKCKGPSRTVGALARLGVALTAARVALEERVTAVSVDADRIDWLARMGCLQDGDTWRFGIIHAGGVLTENVSVTHAPSFRAAVDSARDARAREVPANG
jgi:hypothetical protein